MFAQRANIIRWQFFAFINEAANLAHPTFLFRGRISRFGFRLDIGLIVTVSDGRYFIKHLFRRDIRKEDGMAVHVKIGRAHV